MALRRCAATRRGATFVLFFYCVVCCLHASRDDDESELSDRPVHHAGPAREHRHRTVHVVPGQPLVHSTAPHQVVRVPVVQLPPPPHAPQTPTPPTHVLLNPSMSQGTRMMVLVHGTLYDATGAIIGRNQPMLVDRTVMPHRRIGPHAAPKVAPQIHHRGPVHGAPAAAVAATHRIGAHAPVLAAHPGRPGTTAAPGHSSAPARVGAPLRTDGTTPAYPSAVDARPPGVAATTLGHSSAAAAPGAVTPTAPGAPRLPATADEGPVTQAMAVADTVMTGADSSLGLSAGIACSRGWEMPVAQAGHQLSEHAASWSSASNVPASMLEWMQVGARAEMDSGWAQLHSVVGPLAIPIGAFGVYMTCTDIQKTSLELDELHHDQANAAASEQALERSEEWWTDVRSFRIPDLDSLDLADEDERKVAIMEYKEESLRLSFASLGSGLGGVGISGLVLAGFSAAAPVGIALSVTGGSIMVYKNFLRDDPGADETWSQWRARQVSRVAASLSSVLEISEVSSMTKNSTMGIIEDNLQRENLEKKEIESKKASVAPEGSGTSFEDFLVLQEAWFAYQFAKSARMLVRETFRWVEVFVQDARGGGASRVHVHTIKFEHFSDADADPFIPRGKMPDREFTREEMFQFVLDSNPHAIGQTMDISLMRDGFGVVGGSSHREIIPPDLFKRFFSQFPDEPPIAAEQTKAWKTARNTGPIVQGVDVTYDDAGRTVTMALKNSQLFKSTAATYQMGIIEVGKYLMGKANVRIYPWRRQRTEGSGASALDEQGASGKKA